LKEFIEPCNETPFKNRKILAFNQCSIVLGVNNIFDLIISLMNKEFR